MSRRLLLFSVLYALAYTALLVSLSSVRPLWLDEILQLMGTRALSGAALVQFARGFPGAGPLGYFIQHWAIAVLGYSLLSARLPSAIFAVLSGIVLFRFAGRYSRWLVLLLWAVLPLQLRYALEARPYSQGLFFAALATACFFHLLSRPSAGRAAAYMLAVALGIYSAPYTLFVQAGFVAWLLIERRAARETAWAAIAVVIAAASYLPWYFASASQWRTILAAGNISRPNLSARFFLLPIQEISGGGYVCSIALIALAILGCASPALSRSLKMFLLSAIVVGLFGPILTNAVFGYFFAIRQVMFILVPLMILAAHAFDKMRWNPVAGSLAAGFLAAILLAGSVVKDVHYFSDRTEDWDAGAAAIHATVQQGACLQFASEADQRLYAFFDPSLVSRDCKEAASIAIPAHRYSDPAILRKLLADLTRKGYEKTRSIAAGGTDILLCSNRLQPASRPATPDMR